MVALYALSAMVRSMGPCGQSIVGRIAYISCMSIQRCQHRFFTCVFALVVFGISMMEV